MGDPAARLWSAVRPGLPLALVFYPDLGLKDEVAAEVESFFPPDTELRRLESVDDAVGHPNALVLLFPTNEKGALEALEGRRDMLLDRELPIVVFILRHGDGARELPHLPGLAGWVRGRDVDPEEQAEVDLAAEREDFRAETGLTPDEWAAKHSPVADSLDTETLRLFFRSLLLREPR